MRRRLPPPATAAFQCGCKKVFRRKQDLKSHKKQSLKPKCKLSKRVRLEHHHTSRRSRDSASNAMDVDDPYAGDHDSGDRAAQPSRDPSDRRARVEEIVDEGDTPVGPSSFCTPYPTTRKPGLVHRTGSPPAESEFRHLHGDESNPYFPFASEAEWELAQWFKSEAITDSAVDRYCKMPSVSDCPH